jgi:pimeloyl-ACP methyl ester carboxylesterase
MRRRHFGRVESGRRVIVEVEWSGTAIGDVIGKGEGDREYRYSGLVLMEIERGKIRRQIIYSDVATLREQLGPALTAPSAPGSAPLRAPGRLVDVGGYRLHIHCVGHRSPTLIIDGGVAVWSIFYHGLQEALAPETRVCTYDRAGMGWSDRGPQPRTARQIVAELARLLTNAGETGSVLVAGHSFGGLIARMFARKYPDRTAGVVLVESGHPAQWRRLPRQAWDLVVEGQMLYRQAAAAARDGTLGAADVPAAPFRDSPAIRATYVAAMLTPTPYEGAADELDAMAESFEQFSALGDLGATPLAVVTARSSFAAFAGTPIPVDSANAAWWEMQTELTRLSSNVRHFVSILGDHNVVWTDLTTTIAAIRDLLARVRSLPR